MTRSRKKAVDGRERQLFRAFVRALDTMLGDDPPPEPRVLLYGLFTEPFTLRGKRYYWTVETGRWALRRVDWDETEET